MKRAQFSEHLVDACDFIAHEEVLLVKIQFIQQVCARAA